MENLKLTLTGIGSVLLLIFAVVAALTLSDTPGSSDNSSSTSGTTAAVTAATTKAPETTPSTTKAQTTTPVTTKAPETTPPATTEPLEWAEEAVSGIMYVNQTCYSRIKAIVGSDAAQQYQYGTAVNVTAYTDTGYYKLDNGEYIHGDYLSETLL